MIFVIPGKYSLSQPFYFMFTPSYYECGSCSDDAFDLYIDLCDDFFVISGKYGLSQPFYFMFTPSYYGCGSCSDDASELYRTTDKSGRFSNVSLPFERKQ